MSLVYRGLKAQYETIPVTDEEIDRQMERLRQATPAIQVIKNRPAQLGDEVLLDYAGFCGGVQFPGGTAENQALTLGSGMFIPGFEEQLLGKWPEQETTVRVTFPEAYQSEDLAGKEAEFRCLIHEIRVKSEYALDDAFAKEVGGCPSLAAMRTKMGESLQNYYEERAEQELQDRLIRQAAEGLEYSPSAEEIDQAVEEQLQTLKAQLSHRGLTLEAYCQFTEKSEAELREEVRPEAEQSLRIRAAVAEIAALEQLEAEQKDLADAWSEICQQNGITMEQLQEYRDEAFDEAVRRSVLTRKVLRLIRDSAEITMA